MQSYKSINSKKPSRLKKIIIIIAAVTALILVILAVVGIITNPNGEEMQRVSETVSENVRLKQQISELEQQLEDMQSQIDSLNNDLLLRPTVEPSPYASPEGSSPEPTGTAVPR